MSPLRKPALALAAAMLCTAAAAAQEFHVGARVSGFTVTNLQGGTVAYSPSAGDVTVVIFISTRCPVSNSYNTRMNDLYREYSAKGVKFLFINANQNEPPQEVEEHAAKAGFAFPVYKDASDAVADRFGAQYTPETFVIDRSGTVRYHGRIDDAQNPARVRQQSLRQAIDAVLAGGTLDAPETKAFGCTIKRLHKTS